MVISTFCLVMSYVLTFAIGENVGRGNATKADLIALFAVAAFSFLGIIGILHFVR